MAELIDGTGVVIRTSRNACAVSVTINGSSKSLIFNKSLFFTFGVQCEGNMTNILENGMEVELCYKISRPEGKCCILAVWLGEKPDSITEGAKSIYDMSGRVVSSIGNDNFLIKDEDSRTVRINKDVVFRDGSLLPDSKTLAIDEKISFDAIPFASEHPSGATYQATCAWIGPKPKIVDRFKLRSADYDIKFPDDIVQGIVAVIPNDVVAVIDVVLESMLKKVLLFRSSFKRGCARLGDVVDVGDRLCIRLRYQLMFLGREWWYALEAFRCDETSLWSDINLDSDVSHCEEVSDKVATAIGGSGRKNKLGTFSVPTSLMFGLAEVASVLKSTKENPPKVMVPKLFTKKCLSQGRGYLLNCSGSVISEEVQNKIEVNLKHTVGTSVLMIRGVTVSRRFPSSERYLIVNNTQARFDAEFPMSRTCNRDFRVVVVWKGGESGRDSIYRLDKSMFIWGNKKLLPHTTGKIESIPLPDSAIAIFGGRRVLVTLDSLLCIEEINLKTSTIDSYLSVGDTIFANIEKRKYKNNFYYIKAVRCFVGEFSNLTADTQFNMSVPRRTTWTDVWGFGESYRKEPIVYEDGKFLLTFVSVKRPNVVCNLDLLEKGNVFVHGKLADFEMLKPFVSHEITFHVAHTHSDDLEMTRSKGMFVACAWIGQEPPPKLIFKEILAVPRGSVSCFWRYEAVVTSFPLPSHALCYIGHVPILVLIIDGKKNLKFPDLKIGDRLFVGAHEDSANGTDVVLSNDVMNLKKASEVVVNEVYKNFTGIVVSLPEPVGKISVTNYSFEVSFELCHVRRFKKTSDLSDKEWFANVRNNIAVGKQVYVSAVKTNKCVPCRALEVYFDE